MRYYCTLFDVNYLPNFLALYDSLVRNSTSLKIYAFCMDDESFQYLSEFQTDGNNEIISISLDQLQNEFPELERIKKERSVVEFYFTCSSFICSYVFNRVPVCDYINYLDADLLFFDSPEIIFSEIGDASIAIIPHKFYGWGKKYLKYGVYNVGWVTFKNDSDGRACLDSWRSDCAEWCYDYYDEKYERFGDQKYLDKWEASFSGVRVIQQKGANLAPWNAGQYKVSKNKQGKILVDVQPLVFYHFASFKKVDETRYTTNLSRYMARPGRVLKNDVYKTYLDRVSGYSKLINETSNEKRTEVLKKNRVAVETNLKKKATQLFSSLTRWFYNDYIYE
jgi:hypothetical protein